MSSYDSLFIFFSCMVAVGTIITGFFVRKEMRNLDRKSSD